MKRFKGKIISDILNKESEFFKVIDINEGKTYRLLKNQVLFPVTVGKEYDFFIENTIQDQVEYISIMHPDFLVSSEAEFRIESLDKVGDDTYFAITSNFEIPLKVRKLPCQKPNIKKVKCRVYKYKMGKPYLKNIDFQNDNFKLYQKYNFNIVEYSQFTDKKGKQVDSIILKSEFTEKNIEVRRYEWHKKEIWNFEDVVCEVIGFDRNCNPKLRIIDSRHPFYSIGSKNKFRVEKIKKRVNIKTNQPFFVLVVSDQHNFRYEVSALPNQERRIQEGFEIECEVKAIDTKVRLSQIKSDDPFFYTFKEIVEDKTLEKNYFSNFLNFKSENDTNIEQLKTQYNSSQGFWVFTYCNSILPGKFRELISKKDYVQANEVNNLLIQFESWILNSGILRALHDEDERKITKKRANNWLNRCKEIEKVLSYIIDTRFDDFLDHQKLNPSLQQLYYFILFSNVKLINGKKFTSIILTKNVDSKDDLYFIEKIADQIETNKQDFINKMSDNYFVLLNSNNEFQDSIDDYKLWTFCQYQLFHKIDHIEKRNLALAKLFRYSVKNSQSLDEKIKLLSNSFNILIKKISNSNFEFNDKYDILPDKLCKNPNINNSNKKIWSEIEDAESNKRFLTLKVVERHNKEFEVEYKGIVGYLPYQNITCIKLKRYNQRRINWEINAEVVISGKVFGLFTVKQLEEGNPSFLSKNLKIDSLPKVGSIISGIVKSIVAYGVFISTEYGDGLLHLNNVEESFSNKKESLKYFREGEEIFVRVIKIENDGKIEFGLKQLIGTNYESFYRKKIFEELNDNYEIKANSLDSLKKNIEIEKGNIIEQYAVISNNLDHKIKYIKLSKYFFSNIHHPKSYLHNIYIDYFQRLNELDEIIKNYSIVGYNQFSQKIQKINLQPRTLKEFPESENLIVFIKILGLFNKTDSISNLTLFELVQKYSNRDDKKLLSVLSKTTFANNLMTSEVLGDEENERIQYSLKNLKVIRNYIENGVFSVAESKEDKLARELEEKRVYWRKKINQDEGETLEFKSTLITPVPDQQKKEILKKLEYKLNTIHHEKDKKGIHNKINEIKGDTAQKRIIHSAFKTIAAFANTEGGVLLLGVSDDKSIYGLNEDYDSFKEISDKNRDGFGKFLDSKLKTYFGDSFSSQYLKKEFLKFPEGDILIIKVKASKDEIFLLRDENDKPSPGILYVRNLSSTIKLEGVELAKFLKSRTSEKIYSKIENKAESTIPYKLE